MTRTARLLRRATRTAAVALTSSAMVATLSHTTWARPADGREAGADAGWTRTWGTALGTAAPAAKSGVTGRQTLRMVVHTSTGGDTVRIQLANTFAATPVLIGHATIARRSAGADAAGTPVTLTFGGSRQTVIGAGEKVRSDQAAFPVKADEDLLISVHLPEPVAEAPYHDYTLTTSYASAPGDGADRAGEAAGGRFPARFTQWAYLDGVDVTASGGDGTVVAFGDSQTDGGHTTPDTNRRWSDRYGRALQASGRHTGVVNAGISGNRLLTDSTGTRAAYGRSGLNRFTRDVLEQPGVRSVILYEGINDIALDGADSASLIEAIRHLAARAHAAGLTFTAATIPPFAGYGAYTPAKEQTRQEVNQYIRTSPDLDGRVDFDRVSRDPRDPTRLFPGYYDRGDDRLHLNDNGNQALANAVMPAPPTRPAPRFTQTVAADFTGDGIVDLVARKDGGDLMLWPGNPDADRPGRGDGTFARPVRALRGWDVTQTVAGDFTGDGKADLIGMDTENVLKLWAGKGDGTFADPVRVTGGWYFTQTAAADFTGDGKVDLVARMDNGDLLLWPGRGDGTFAQRKTVTSGWHVTQVVAGDFTGDGKADLVGKEGNVLRLWPGTGNGLFGPVRDQLSDWSRTQTTAGDFSGDGVADLVARDDATGDLNEWLNTEHAVSGRPLLLTGDW
ncbi:FG-GAP-like repeat-containing protein [Streptomyces monomycini]|uniref:FG-GAP-like repeat-containing protein n=1 Tax=Streptomyces monomycini TaxID=371720 RepID=UPI00067A93E2|nr:FG-GAP-like repeat-containing protein [Streptomyces monomycini]